MVAPGQPCRATHGFFLRSGSEAAYTFGESLAPTVTGDPFMATKKGKPRTQLWRSVHVLARHDLAAPYEPGNVHWRRARTEQEARFAIEHASTVTGEPPAIPLTAEEKAQLASMNSKAERECFESGRVCAGERQTAVAAIEATCAVGLPLSCVAMTWQSPSCTVGIVPVLVNDIEGVGKFCLAHRPGFARTFFAV